MRKNQDEEIIREMIREVLVQEGFLEDLWVDLKKGVGKAYDFISPYFGIDDPKHGILKALDDLHDEADSNDEAAKEVIKKAEILGMKPLIPGSSSVPGGWRARLGTETARGINFHKLEDGRNNYRGALDETVTIPSKEFFEELRDDYGIERVITLNADNGGDKVRNYVRQAGLESVYVPMGESDPPSRENFDRIKRSLEQGNALIHCTHGADRTGAMVGRYYIEELGWDTQRAIDDAKKYGGHKRDFPRMRKFLELGPEDDREPSMSDLMRPFKGSVADSEDTDRGTDVRIPDVSGPELPDISVGGKRIKRLQDKFYKYDKYFADAAQREGIPFGFLKAVAIRESSLNPRAESSAGAYGLMQFMPKTAQRFGIDAGDPIASIYAAAKYLKMNQNRFDGSLELAAAAYNAGEGTVERVGRRIPNNPETQAYVPAVMDLYNFIDQFQPGYS